MDTRTCNPIREARRRAGLSQRQLADRLGVHKVTVSGWENGRFLPRPAQTLKPHDPRHFERILRLRRQTAAPRLP